MDLDSCSPFTYSVDENIPNITGNTGQRYAGTKMNGGWHNYSLTDFGTGALYLSGPSVGSSCSWENYRDASQMYFSANRSNPKYTNVNRLFPLSIKGRMLIRY